MAKQWVLESVAADGSLQRHVLEALPFRIGRGPDNDLVVPSGGLSRQHAEISQDIWGRLRLTDLDSTNGTWINRKPLQGTGAVADGDVLHFGPVEFRLRRAEKRAQDSFSDSNMHTMMVSADQLLSEHFVPHEREFLDLLAGRGMAGAAQPIVHVADRTIFAYELLGRAVLPPLPSSPVHLFALASALNKDVELSAAFREYGLARLGPQASGRPIFVNTHPKETFTAAFYQSLCHLRQFRPELDVVVELHETAVTDIAQVRELARKLADIGVRFAYDDFGAGQARLNELGEVPAHFVKFDMGMIRGIDQAHPRKQQVVADLVRIVRQVGSVALAEGVETEGEAGVCAEMGFALIQGYLTGKPQPLESLGEAEQSTLNPWV